MKVVPLAADSMGVRSMATFVQTDDCKVLIDPRAALGPSRYNLPPTKPEVVELRKRIKWISNYAKLADIFVISHYHYDHHDPVDKFYAKKRIMAKSYEKDINRSQEVRAREFEDVHGASSKIAYCDGKTYHVGETRISFSEPVPHGAPGSKLGYVLMTTIESGIKFMHASDVQGPISAKAMRVIARERPDILYLDGPSTYLLGAALSKEQLETAIRNLLTIIKEIDCEIILDHHLTRDRNYRKRLERVYERGKVVTAAEYLGKENNLLEARRKEIFEGR